VASRVNFATQTNPSGVVALHQEKLDVLAESFVKTVMSDFVNKTPERQLTFGIVT